MKAVKYSFINSIRTRLVFLVFVSVLPALGIIIYAGLDHRRHNIKDAENSAMRVLADLAYTHEHAVENTRGLLLTLARIPDVQNLNIPACNRLFGMLLKENPLYANIFASNADGMVIANALPFTPHSISHRRYYQDAVKTHAYSAGEAVTGLTLQRPVFHFAYPILNEKNDLKGIVTAAIDLAGYGRIFAKAKLPESSVLAIYDRNHVRLYRYPEKYIGGKNLPEAIQHTSAGPDEGTFTAAGPDGVKRLGAYKKFYLQGNTTPYLYMRVAISEEKALFHTEHTFIVNIALLGCAFIAAILLAWALGNAIITRRMNKIIDASLKLGQGDLSARTGLDHDTSEFGQLAFAFDGMAETLEHNETEQKLAEEKLRLSEEKYRSIFENAIEGIYQTTPEGSFLSVNPVLANMLGYGSPEELIESITNLGLQVYAKPDERDKFLRIIQEKGSVTAFEQKLKRKNGSTFWASLNARTVKDEAGKAIYYEGTIEDINERKLAREALNKSERLLADIIEFLPDATFVINLEGKVIAWNRAVEKMTGVSKEDMIGQGDHAYTVPFYGERRHQLLDLIDVNNKELESKYQNVQRRGNTLYAEVFTPCLHGGKGAHIWATGAPLFDDSGIRVGAIESMRDITDIKLAEEKIKASLKEKEVLLKEIQHRVKNNLLTISGILTLQVNRIKDEESKDAFMTSINRINALTKIHAKLYQSNNYAFINFKEYITELLWEISSSYKFPSDSMITNLKDISLDVNIAIPTGLIINELVSNVMKHAFPDNKIGQITVTLSSDDSHIILAVSDNGIGIPHHIDFENTESIGLSLVRLLIEQINGSIELSKDKGTKFTIVFPIGIFGK